MDGLQSIALEGEAIIDVHGVTVSLLNLSAPDPPDEEVWARLAKLSSWQIFINAPHYEFWHEGSWLATLPNGVPKLLRAIIGRDLAGAIEDAVESEPVE
ncbi:MAG: hypothetical protein OXT70_01210, partial [Chloroflexota bacterium]|nr:hypothetical protein [Chloroflexota bacterium]